MFLNNHTYYSFKYGTLSPHELLDEACALGLQQLVLTDINSTSACLDFVRIAQKRNVKPILGIDFRNGNDQVFVAIAQNNMGYQEINNFLSEHLHGDKCIARRAPKWENVHVIYPEKKAPDDLLPFEYVGITQEALLQLHWNYQDRWRGKYVWLHAVSFRNKKDFNAHRLLRAIQLNTLLSKLPKEEQGSEKHCFVPLDKVKADFENFPEILALTQRLLDTSSIAFEIGNHTIPKNQRCYTNSVEEDVALLRELAQNGLEYRYPKQVPNQVLERLNIELDVIEKKHFVSYFLINWDIVSFAQKHNFFYVGRGSGANSLVAYLLRITDVDPVELNLYFERFINPYRSSPPDFDIDFSWRDRPTITRYIFERFKHVALLGAYNTFQFKSTTRELGKVLGVPAKEIQDIQQGIKQHHQLDKMGQLVLKYSHCIEGFPSHVSPHSCGIIISEEPVHNYSATILPPKGFPTLMFDMHVSEDVGLFKFDILSQRGLAKNKEALEIIRHNHPDDPEIDIHDIAKFKKDKKVKMLLREGQALGCFYVESPAMRMLMTKLRVDNYLGLVAASSIIRPGVAQSGMMAEYIKRYRDVSARKGTHPVLNELLEETYGVMVYQEDVLKVAHYYGGLSLAEADILRRGMSFKYRDKQEFVSVKEKFMTNSLDKGYPEGVTQEVWRQMESFANYAFAKGHSASYAVESYQSLYLKAHYPIEYMVACVNNFGGFYSVEIYLHEARMDGASIHPPCVNESVYETRLKAKSIYLGFQHIKSLEEKSIEAILKARQRDGLFADLDDVVHRTGIGLEQCILLIRIGAFQFTACSKQALLWRVHFLLSDNKHKTPRLELFRPEAKHFELPPLETHIGEDAYDEIELLGFPLCSPFELIGVPRFETVLTADLYRHLGRKVDMLLYLVHYKPTKTREKFPRLMYFGTFLDADGYVIDTVHFPDVAKRYPFTGKGVYHVRGIVCEEYDYISIEVDFMEKLPYVALQSVAA